MTTRREEFLAGERPDDVAVFLSGDRLSNREALDGHAERVEDGVVLVVDGQRGRDVLSRALGIDAMGFAGTAMGTTGSVDPDLTGGECPDGPDGGHEVQFLLAFAEERAATADGIYADGDVIHAYAQCSCGTTYSDRWVVREREA